MATTPPPARRIRTPPTPLHGSRFDQYEPYSPRRSHRIASRTSGATSLGSSSKPRLHARYYHSSPSVSTATDSSIRQSSQALSPPASPASPIGSASKRVVINSSQLSPRRQRQPRFGLNEDSDSDNPHMTSSIPKPDFGQGMLPTPAKTPRKRVVASDAVDTTARVLFPGRAAKAEHVMPPSRRSGKAARSSLFDLDDTTADTGIVIYTDSKERVPELDDAEENPFIVGSKGSHRVVKATNHHVSRPTKSAQQIQQAKELVEEMAEMERMVKNDEGIIYVFRGRKVFRRFDDKPSRDALDSEPEDLVDNSSSIKRKAGAVAKERFTRSSITPRLLFPTPDSQLRSSERQRIREEEEEAETDIELPLHASQGDGSLKISGDLSSGDNVALQGDSIAVTSPLSADFISDSEAAESHVKPTDTGTSSRVRSKKPSPFDSWQRTKAASRGVYKGAKRDREVESVTDGRASNGKRIRSAVIGPSPEI